MSGPDLIQGRQNYLRSTCSPSTSIVVVGLLSSDINMHVKKVPCFLSNFCWWPRSRFYFTCIAKQTVHLLLCYSKRKKPFYYFYESDHKCLRFHCWLPLTTSRSKEESDAANCLAIECTNLCLSFYLSFLFQSMAPVNTAVAFSFVFSEMLKIPKIWVLGRLPLSLNFENASLKYHWKELEFQSSEALGTLFGIACILPPDVNWKLSPKSRIQSCAFKLPNHLI